MVFVRFGPSMGNALLVTTAPGQQVTRRKTNLKAKGRAKARKAIGALLHLPIANVPPRLLEPRILLPEQGATHCENEVHLLQAKKRDPLALTT